MSFARRPWSCGSQLAVLLLAGCNGCQSEETLPHLLDADDPTPTAVWVAEGLGTSPVNVAAYATTSLGAPVPAGDLTIESDATAAGSVTPDAGGWADIEVSAGSSGAYTLGISAGGLSGENEVWIVDAAPGNFDAGASPLPGESTRIARAGAGVVAAIGNEVWWSGLDGRPPARVLALSDAVIGLSAVQVDSDGVTDLLVTSATNVTLLRGRDGGGLVFGAGWTAADGLTIAGASLSDFDGDSLPDLSVALVDDASTKLSILSTDGTWGFTAVDSLELPYVVYALSIDDLDENGIGEVTLLTEDGLLRRYTKIDGSWAATLSGSQFDLNTAQGAVFLPSTDLTADGIPDFLAAGPALDGTGWLAWVIDIGSGDAAQYPIVGELADYEWLGFAVGDLTGDGRADFAYAAPDKLTRGVWKEDLEDPTRSTFELSAWTIEPAQPGMAIFDADGDGTSDIVFGGSELRVLRGVTVEDDPGTEADESIPWKPDASPAVVFGIDLLLEPAIADLNGDGVADVVALVQPTGAGVQLQGFLGVPAADASAETLRSGGSVVLSGGGAARAFAVCGTRAYALYEEADDLGNLGTWLARADIGAGLGPSLDGSAVAVTGTALACGDFELGEVAVVDSSGAVTFVDAAGNTTAGGNIGAAGAVAAIPGDPYDSLTSCAEAGCYVAAADLDGDGVTDLVVQDSTGVTVTLADASYAVDEPGTVRVDDADGDGLPDLVFGSTGLARVVRAVEGGLTPAVASWTWRPVSDAIRFGDLDGDGLPDAFLFGIDSDPSSTAGDDWVGTLLYARAVFE